MKKGYVVAIDGPVASGKGTIATLLAQRIHGVNINTGGMYRALALRCQNADIDLNHTEKILPYLSSEFITVPYDPAKPYISRVALDGIDVTDRLSTPELSMGSSRLARDEAIARKMSLLQREIGQLIVKDGVPVVMEGRQIGTEVFPDADVKIYLNANLQVRAQRRFEQYSKQGIRRTLSQIVEETKMRDEQDMNRAFGPLVKDPEHYGYITVDNSSMDEKETLSVIIVELLKKGLISSE